MSLDQLHENANVVGTRHHDLQIYDEPGQDSFRLLSRLFSPGDDHAQIFLNDTAGDAIAPGSNNLVGIAPTEPLDPSSFDSNCPTSNPNFFSRCQSRDSIGNSEGIVFSGLILLD